MGGTPKSLQLKEFYLPQTILTKQNFDPPKMLTKTFDQKKDFTKKWYCINWLGHWKPMNQSQQVILRIVSDTRYN